MAKLSFEEFKRGCFIGLWEVVHCPSRHFVVETPRAAERSRALWMTPSNAVRTTQ